MILTEGEEIVGLKQNRILNTTVVVKEKTTTEIPVSCCEAGRWSYRRPSIPTLRRPSRGSEDNPGLQTEFSASRTERIHEKEYENEKIIISETIISSNLRGKKVHSVTQSIKNGYGYKSNQGMVWGEIDKIHRKVGVYSQTSPFQDSFKKIEKQLLEIDKVFKLQENQKGLVVLINGKVAGCDFFGSSKLFSKLYNKILKSYTFDAYVEKMDGDFNYEPLQLSKTFFEEILNSKEVTKVNLGDIVDFRYESGKITGFALVYEDKVVHGAFFPKS